jgi:hypothetical protein
MDCYGLLSWLSCRQGTWLSRLDSWSPEEVFAWLLAPGTPGEFLRRHWEPGAGGNGMAACNGVELDICQTAISEILSTVSLSTLFRMIWNTPLNRENHSQDHHCMD